MGKDWYEGCTENRWWRLNHLYFINTKEHGVIRFKANWAQEYLYKNLWHRNNILKARQLGMSTFSSLMMLDHCLHRENFCAGINDKTQPDAEEKMGKIELAYKTLDSMPVDSEFDHVEDPEDRKKIAEYAKFISTAVKAKIGNTKAQFSNGSQIMVGTSLRGGTIHYLHISEFGYVAAHDPAKATEIISGSIPTVPKNGVLIMESTHEGGKYGENYRMTKEAMEKVGKKLTTMDFKFFFFPWWQHPDYYLEGNGHDTVQDVYFEQLQRQGIELTEQQKRWYCVQAKTYGYRVKTEYPSTPEEAFTQRVEGAIYGSEISHLRANGKMAAEFEPDAYCPLYVSWDIGLNDYTALWLIQPCGDGKFYVLDYYCSNDKPLSHYTNHLQWWERKYNKLIEMNLLPHDASTRINLGSEMTSYLNKVLETGQRAVVIPRCDSVWKGIYAAKDILPHCVFHKRCGEPVRSEEGMEYMSGVDALENYQRGGVGANGVERTNPLHNACSHGADAFRIFAEAFAAGYVSKQGARKQENLPAMRGNLRKTAKGVPNWW